MSELNKTIVKRWVEEVVNKGDLDLIEELFSEEFLWTNPFSAEPMCGPEAMRQMVTAFRSAFPDLAVNIEAILADGDKVTVLYTASGRNDGEMMGNPATGKSATWRAIHILTVHAHKIVEDVTVMDRLGLMEQLGA
jgi:steroid delta-isomerase-like uncharacterized protein